MTAPTRPITVPGDKSIAHRALILAALAHGESVLRNVPAGLDVQSTRRALSALGVRFGDEGGALHVTGSGGNLVGPADAIDCGNSGTTIRLLAGVVATRALDVTLDGDASLRKRPMRRIAEPLAGFGADIDLSPSGTAPFRVRGNPHAVGVDATLLIPSAQVKSAILLAALGARGVTRVDGAIASRDHTERLLRAFGVACANEDGALLVEGPAQLRATEIDIPGDMSSAAFLLAAAAAVPGARVVVDGVGLNPTRTAFLDVLRRFGAGVAVEVHGEGAEPRGRVTVTGAALHAVTIAPFEAAGLIDELPLVGVLGAFARGTTVVSGASELRVKESDRIATFAAAGRALGIEIDTFDDGFMVHGPARIHSGSIVTAGDHRIAMAFTVAARASAVDVVLDDPDCVAVSFPGFSNALDAVT
jgi:3-phosphoshikimate 1-carboxyvinyltransferase